MLLFLAPLAAWIDFKLALGRGWQPSPPLVTTLRALSGLLAAGVASLLLPPVRRLLARKAGSVALVGASLTFSVLLSEVVAMQFRILPVEDLYHLRDPYRHQLFRPIPGVMPGVEGEAHVRVNSNGIRGDELPKLRRAYRILCVGGSTTECLYLDQPETWPQLLQDRLRAAGFDRRVWVGNIGISGYCTSHHLLFMRRSNLVEQMDCVVFLVGMNELTLFLRNIDFERSWNAPPRAPHPALFDTALGKLVTALHERRTTPPPEDAMEIEDRIGSSYILRRKERAESQLIDCPDLEGALEDYRVRIVELIGLCRERGVRGVFVTQPVAWKEGMTPEEKSVLWMGLTARRDYVDEVQLRRAIERYNDVLVDACREYGVELVDLRPMAGNTRYFYDDCHFNEAGAVEVARRLAEYFVRTGK